MSINLDLLKITPQELNDLAQRTADTIAQKDRLKTHQLRNVFSAIEKMRTLHKQIVKSKSEEKTKENRDKLEMQLIMLKPKIAYAAGRQKSVRYNFFPLVEAAVNAVDKVLQSENVQKQDLAYTRFFALMESVVAYHKFYEK